MNLASLPIMSVSGIRGAMNESITEEFFAVIAYLHTKAQGGGKMVIGRDTRPSGGLLARAACRGIRAAGGTPIDIGIAPTPTTCFAVSNVGALGGIIITASHNPHPYNGYKMVHASGRLCNGTECEAVYAAFRAGDYPSWTALCTHSDQPAQVLDAVTPHLDAITAAVNVAAIRSAKLTVAVDAINGAASVIFPKLLERLGVSWEGVHCTTSGDFVHNPEPRPEHLGDLAALLKSKSYFAGGFVYDPDADRLATMGEHGEPISEEMTLAMAMENVLSKTKTSVATNLSTSMIIDEIAASHGCSVIRTKIGEANVVEGMQKNKCALGGEGNGGVIYPAVSTVRDGLCGTALILELMAKTGKTITQITAPWPVYPIVKEKIALGDMIPAEVLKRLEAQFSGETIDTQDGLKITYADGWVHLRASNTEPIMRCYAEAKTEACAQELAAMVMDKI